MLTTTIGAFPKPPDVQITDWFSISNGEYTRAYLKELAATNDNVLDAAVHAVVCDQTDAGIDIPTDGEIRRENYIHYQCRQLTGIDFAKLSYKRIRGTTDTSVPTIRGEIGIGESLLPRDFRVAQAATASPVKITIPGPMTIIDSVVDDHYRDDVFLGADLAVAINNHIRALADAGCTNIQVDEPVMARKPEIALHHGIDHLARCFDGVDDAVTRIAHACCGYPNSLDEVGYPKADRGAYLELADALNEAPIDQISIEDAHAHNDLDVLLPRFGSTTIILGVVGIACSRIETVDEIEQRLRQAVDIHGADRLIAAPDCGLGYLSREQALQKLRNLSTAAHRLAD
ncbi:MAG: cobalamin-independent methionine synthase II family protein [Acidimicrobiales bacterium]|nr:cobalamin-independent methionine synthase II family protein [Acidimicrobiales bacterium]MDG2216687.1 cobalamin-independent methionine synthase II family protein [Acidimicrobiales bacterium]